MVGYNARDLDRLSSRIKKKSMRMIIVGIVAIVVIIGASIMVTEDTATLFTVISSIVLVLSGWYILGSYFLIISPGRLRLRHIRRLLAGERINISGKVEIGNQVTVFGGILAFEIAVDGHILYWEADDLPFGSGEVVSFSVIENFIVAFEVQK